MKKIRSLLMAVLTLVGLIAPRTAQGQTNNNNPVIVPHDDRDILRDLRGAPREVQTLIVSFDKTRDQFLAQQAALLVRLKNAATPADREAIREQLQSNRQGFLDALKDFRKQLKDELAALKGKISHQEFLRIMDAAHDAATEGGIGHHKGH